MNRTSPARAATAAAVVLATTGGLLGAAATASSAAVTCASPVFKRQFFANTSFSGTPKKTDCDSKIDQNWGTGAPASGLPSNNFGVRWSVTRDFGSGGPFTFTASSRDGIRVYLDGVRKVDLWKNVSTTVSKTVNLTVPSGKHSLRIDFVNWTGSANVKFAYTPRTTASVDKVKPLTPGGAALTYSTATHQAKLSWTKSPEMDLAGYQVFRRLQGGSYPAKPLATTTSTSYTDTPPKDGRLYYYEVRAYDKAGNVSSGTADKGITTVDLTGPAAPSGLTGGTDFDGAHLIWKPVADATRYELVRKDPQSGSQSVVGSTTQTSFLDREHMAGVYQVRGYDAAGNAGALSAAITLDGTDTTPPATPHGMEAVVTADVIFLRARMPYGAPLSEELGNGARLHFYRTEGTGADTRTVDVVCEGETRPGLDSSHLRTGNDAVFQCTDDTVADAVTYTYTSRMVDGEGNASAPSESVTVVSADRVPPGHVRNLTATPRADGVLVGWDPPADEDIAVYSARVGTRNADGTVTWRMGNCLTVTGDKRSLLCVDVPNGENKLYSVIAKDRYGNWSKVTDPAFPSVAVTELDIVPGEPADDTGQPLWGAGGWTMSEDLRAVAWMCSTAADLCDDIVEYQVSRWNPETQSYDLLGTTQPLPAGEYVYFTDESQPLGSVSYYRVVGVLADGTVTEAAHPWLIRPDLD
ncbi:PA14 domain-containing protein [Streptomyces abyssomicinicus]|uniref:PA14 domain-containing protein n=1 Tax=Streptomyces abyssomicinicus TaxID=574929 RepID=UPI001FE5582A|nr:PA14 domain-containing protein [Streptomyces abyssomicinicus]